MLDEPAGRRQAARRRSRRCSPRASTRLPEPERAVLDRAAIEGGTFHRSAVARLLPADAAAGLDERAGARSRGGSSSARRRASCPARRATASPTSSIRDVAYEPRVEGGARRPARGLRRVARRARRRGPRRARRLPPRAGPPLARRAAPGARASAPAARRRGRGAAWPRPAARRCERGDLPAGVSLLERAHAPCSRPTTPTGARTPADLGLALVQLGRLAEADRCSTRPRARAAARGDALAEAHARTARFFALRPARLGRRRRGPRRRLRRARRARSRRPATRSASPGCGARGARALARGPQRATPTRTGCAASTTRGSPATSTGMADALCWQSCRRCVLGPRRSPTRSRAVARSSTSSQLDRHVAALSMRPLAHLHAHGGRVSTSRAALLEQSNAILADLGVSMHSAVAHYDAFVALLAGDPRPRRPSCATGYEQLEAMGETGAAGDDRGPARAGARRAGPRRRGVDARSTPPTRPRRPTTSPRTWSLPRTMRARLLARRGATRRGRPPEPRGRRPRRADRLARRPRATRSSPAPRSSAPPGDARPRTPRPAGARALRRARATSSWPGARRRASPPLRGPAAPLTPR